MKNVGLKLACIAASLVIWIQVASTTVIESEVDLPLRIVNLPEGTTVAGNPLPGEVRVRLRASKLRVLAHRYLGRALGTVQVDLENRQPGPPFLYELLPSDVLTDQEVVYLLPPVRLPLRLDRQVARRLPVQVPVTGRVPADLILLSPPSARPDSVLVVGPERFFHGVKELRTAVIDLGAVTAAGRRTLALQAPHAELAPALAQVTVELAVARLQERVLANVPVIPLVDAGQADVAVSPPACDMLVAGPADSIQALLAADVTVTIPLSGLGEGVHEVRGQAAHPPWVVRSSLDPEVFLVIIGDSARAVTPAEPRR